MFAAAAVTALLMLLPGTLTGIAAGLRPMPAVAAAGPVMMGVAGFAAWATGELDVRWGWWPLFAAWAGVTALSYLCARFIPLANARVHHPDGVGALRAGGDSMRAPGSRSPMWPQPAECATAAIVAAVSLVGSVRYLLPLGGVPDGASNLREAWDLQWHNNFLRWAVEEGIASPTRAGELMNRETAEPMFYPAAWHALGSLIPGDPMLQGNVFGAVAPMVVLPAGAALLAWVVAGRRWGVVAGPAAAIASIVLPEITGSLMITASLPYLLAVAAIPATMALLVTGRTVALVPALAGTFLAHPAAAVAVAVFALVWWLTRPRLGSLARLAVTGVAVALILLPVLIAASTQGESVAEYTGQIGLDRPDSLWWTITGQSNHTQSFGWYPPAAALSFLGAFVLLLRRKPWRPWPVIAIIVLGVVSDSAQSRWFDPAGEWLKMLGTFFYDMAYRIQAPMGVLRLVLIGVAAAWLIEVGVRAVGKLRKSRGTAGSRDDAPVPGAADPLPHSGSGGGGAAGRRRATAAILVAALASAALVPAAWATGDDARTAMLASRGNTYVSDADVRAWDWLERQPHATEGHVLVNPSEGSGWMYARNGLPSLFTHFPWPDPDSELTADALNDLDLAGTGVPGDADAVNDVDVALRTLGIRYVFVSPPSAGTAGGAALASRSWAWWTPGLTAVYQDGPTAIFAVDDMLSADELRAVREDSPKPATRPDPARTPWRQPIIAPAEATSPLAGKVIGVRSGTTGVDRGIEDADRLAGDPIVGRDVDEVGDGISRAFADAVTAELEKRGATVIELSDDASNGASAEYGADGADGDYGDYGYGAGSGTGAFGAESGSGSVTGADAIIDVGMEAKGAGTYGFRVTGLYPEANGYESPQTANLAGGIRDALVLAGFTPGSAYDDDGRVDGIADGISPAFRALPATGIPEVIVSAGNVEYASELKTMKTAEWRGRYARSIADGLSAMFRQP